MSGHCNDTHVGIFQFVSDPARCFEAIDTRHLKIHKDQIEINLLDFLQGLFTTADDDHQ